MSGDNPEQPKQLIKKTEEELLLEYKVLSDTLRGILQKKYSDLPITEIKFNPDSPFELFDNKTQMKAKKECLLVFKNSGGTILSFCQVGESSIETCRVDEITGEFQIRTVFPLTKNGNERFRKLIKDIRTCPKSKN